MIQAELSTATSKEQCRGKTHSAIRSGKLQRPTSCQRCEKDCKPDAHHPDYTQPLLVRWLCKKCHAIEDKDVRTEYPEGFQYKTYDYCLRNSDQQHNERMAIERWYALNVDAPMDYKTILHRLQHKEYLRISKLS